MSAQNLLDNPSSFNTTPTHINLATFQETALETDLPYPIDKAVFTYGALTNPLCTFQQVRFFSVRVFNVFGLQIGYYQHLEAVSDYTHGWNPFYGRDPGPLPPVIPLV